MILMEQLQPTNLLQPAVIFQLLHNNSFYCP